MTRLAIVGREQRRRAMRLRGRVKRLTSLGRRVVNFGRPRVLAMWETRLPVMQVDGRATGRSAARANLDIVVDLCEREKIDYFLIPEPNAMTATLGIADWDAFVAALGRSRESFYVSSGARVRSTTGRRSMRVSQPRTLEALRHRDEIEIFRRVAVRGSGPTYGREWSCRVTRWSVDESGRLVAAVQSSRATVVTRPLATTTVTEFAGRPVTTLDVFTSRHLFDVDFPIDVVYLWVDGSDPQWQERKAAAAGTHVQADAITDARFRDIGELKYSMRSLAYAPWVRRVFLVTDRQLPSWLDLDAPRLTVVDHRELFGDAGTLPTFNSHALGARLHHIEGLAEHYIHFNDDMFLGRDVTPSTFFESNGMSKFFLSKSTLAFADTDELLSHESARRNVVNLLERDFGRAPTNAFYHTPIPQRRSTMAELEERYTAEFETTLNNQFRSHTDIEPNSWLHHYYGYLTGKSIPSKIVYSYIELGSATGDEQLAQLARTRDRDVFCVNDHVDASAEQLASAATWLAKYFPVPSPFEKQTPPA